MEIGIDAFILSGYPHLEECYRFAELVFPHLPLKASTGANAAAGPQRRPVRRDHRQRADAIATRRGPLHEAHLFRARTLAPADRPAAGVGDRGPVRLALGPGPAGAERHGARLLGHAAQRCPGAPCLDQHRAGPARPRHRRQSRFRAGAPQRRRSARGAAAGFVAADAAEHPASGGDPARDPVVRHRRGGQAVPGRRRSPVPDLPQHVPWHPACRPGPDRDGALLRPRARGRCTAG